MLCKKYLIHRNRQVKYYHNAEGFKLTTVVFERSNESDKKNCKTCILYGKCLAYGILTILGTTSIHYMCTKINSNHKYSYKIYLC